MRRTRNLKTYIAQLKTQKSSARHQLIHDRCDESKCSPW